MMGISKLYLYLVLLMVILSFNGVYADEIDDNCGLNESLVSSSNLNDFNIEYVGSNNYSDNLSEVNNILSYGYDSAEYCSLIFCNENYTIIYGFNNNFSYTNLSGSYLDNTTFSSIKDQGYGNTCWAFAALSTLESNILKINSSLVYDFSEVNMRNLMISQSDYGIAGVVGDSGGDYRMAVGYLTSWLGPVLESEDPYDAGRLNSPLFNSTIHIQNVLFNEFNKREDIKKAIYNYGAVVLSYKHLNTFYNDIHKSYYLNIPVNVSLGHSVSIVGWNDTFSKENFNVQPPGDGAWICKNSGGENFGNNGLFYISYYDYYLTTEEWGLCTYTFILNDTNHYNRNYQYDVIRYHDSNEAYNVNDVWCKNCFVSEGNDLLTAVSTYFLDNDTNYTIEIIVNDESKCIQSGFMKNKGYYTILLDNPIPLRINDTFIVNIKLSRNGLARFALCYDALFTSRHHPNQVSFISLDSYNWDDLTNWWTGDSVACIKAFTVHNPLNTTLFLNVSDVVDCFVPVNISAHVVDSEGNNVLKGSVTFIVNGTSYVVDIVDGHAILPFVFENAGNVSVLAYFSDYEYNYSYDSNEVCINKVDVNLSAFYSFDTFFNYTIVKVVLDANTNVTGNVYLFVNNATYLVCVHDNVGFLDFNGFLDIDNASFVKFYGNGAYNPSDNVSLIYLEDMSHIISRTCDVFKYCHGPERFYVTLMYNASFVVNKDVIFGINGVNYTRFTDENGTASLALNIMPGTYDLFTYYLDVNNNLITVHNVVHVHSTIISRDVTKIFRNGTQYWALFLDGEGNPLNDTEVRFNINGVFYTRTTNASGWARLNLNLVQGVYILTACNPITDEVKANTITIISQIESSDLVKYYMNGSQFIVRILDKDGSYVNAGENVMFNINGVFYTRTTNETGHAKLNINLNPGEYIVTTVYDECTNSNIIVVLSTLMTSDLTMHYRDGSRFTAKLVDGQGNPRPGETLTFNINGVLYHRVTDADGVASLNINLVQGHYIITTSFDGLSVSNMIIINS